jgi:hypothetical protein
MELAGYRESGSSAGALRKRRTERQQERGGVVLKLYDEQARGGRVMYAQKGVDIG